MPAELLFSYPAIGKCTKKYTDKPGQVRGGYLIEIHCSIGEWKLKIVVLFGIWMR